MGRGKKALVTGAGGFIGGHLSTELVRRGWETRALLRYNSRSDRGTLEWHDPALVAEVDCVFGDLRDPESVARAVDGCAVVFHLGAQIAIPYSYLNPRDFFETNVIGTLNVAEAVLRCGAERIIHVSTSEVYGSARSVPMTEEHPLGAQSPYAASKVGADKLVDAYHRSFGLPATIVRPFNTYGPHQSARAVIPTIVSQALAGDTVVLGSTDTSRDLTYVADTVSAFIDAADAPAALGRTLHLGTGDAVTIGHIVELVGELLGRSLTVEIDPDRLRPEASEVRHLVSDPTLARELIGWTPSIDLRTGLAHVIDWVASGTARYRPETYTV